MKPVLEALQREYGPDATWLPPQLGYTFLVGYTTRRKRAICLKADEDTSIIHREDVLATYQEVQFAGLVIPFLFFGQSKRYTDESFIFLQYTWEGDNVFFPKVLYRS